MEMVEEARHAAAADLPRLVEMAAAARAELTSQRGGPLFLVREAAPTPDEAAFGALLLQDDGVVLVGVFDQAVLGYSVAHVEQLRDGSTHGVIDELYTEADGRAVGVGEALMGALLGWFRDRGASGVDATALPGNRQTKNFFEMSGFTARLLVMHHRLS